MQTLCSSREPYKKIFASKTLNIRKEVNPSFCFAVLILSHRKTSKCLTPYNACIANLGHWLHHVCLCIVLLTRGLHTGPSYQYLATRHLHLATIFYQLLSIDPFPKKLAPKTCLQGSLWPSSKIFWLKHWVIFPGGGGVLPYMGCIGTCRGIGYGFWGSRSLNSVSFWTLLCYCVPGVVLW